jgi:hypothetical protein
MPFLVLDHESTAQRVILRDSRFHRVQLAQDILHPTVVDSRKVPLTQ